MSAFSDVLLNDNVNLWLSSASMSYATNRTFSPGGYVQPGVAKWVDRAGGISLGYPTITLQLRPPTKDSRIYKVTQKVVLPVLEVTSPSTATGIQPAPTKAYDMTCIMEFMLPERSTLVDRQKLFNLAISSMAVQMGKGDQTGTINTFCPLPSAVTNFEVPY